jgi:hypothetical protein
VKRILHPITDEGPVAFADTVARGWEGVLPEVWCASYPCPAATPRGGLPPGRVEVGDGRAARM